MWGIVEKKRKLNPAGASANIEHVSAESSGEAAGNGLGHDHAHEDSHLSPIPNICSPKDDQTLVVCSATLGP